MSEPTPVPPSFGAALAELEAILHRIEGEEVDLDQLAAELQRAAVLLEICRGKVRKAEVEVGEILARMQAGEGSDPAARRGGAGEAGGAQGTPPRDEGTET
jgi:exodeoxyribonuclease VII small subunit